MNLEKIENTTVDSRTPVLIFNIYHHLGIGILRSLGRLGVTLHAVEPHGGAPGRFSKYLNGRRFLWDADHATEEQTVEFLIDAAKKIGRRAILIPTTDELATLVTDHAAELSKYFMFPAQDAALPGMLASKKEMYYLAKKHNIPTPSVIFPQSVEDVVAFSRTAAFPVMLKGIDGKRLLQHAEKKMFIVNSAEELLTQYQRAEDPTDPNLMLQEYIPGGDDSVWMFNGYFNKHSECLFGITGKKIRQAPVYTGYTSLGICLANPTVEETTIRFMEQIGYRGILDIGYRYDKRDGQYKVLDINPRIGATFRLFVASNGMDVARALYLDLTGQKVPQSLPVEGRKWCVEERDLVSSLHYLRHGKLTLKTWRDSLKGVQESAWFARDDIKPFIYVCIKSALSALLRLKNLSGGKISSGKQHHVDRQVEGSRALPPKVFSERTETSKVGHLEQV